MALGTASRHSQSGIMASSKQTPSDEALNLTCELESNPDIQAQLLIEA